MQSTRFTCQECGSLLYSRRSPKCQACGAPVPKELLLSDEEIRKADEYKKKRRQIAEDENKSAQRFNTSFFE